jgi:hypothetical protein
MESWSSEWESGRVGEGVLLPHSPIPPFPHSITPTLHDSISPSLHNGTPSRLIVISNFLPLHLDQ